MNRRRPLSLEMIRKLHAGLGLPANVLVQPYPLLPYAEATSSPGQHGWTISVLQDRSAERNRQFVAEHPLASSADELFINGDSYIPSARALESIFKARMFVPVEA